MILKRGQKDSQMPRLYLQLLGLSLIFLVRPTSSGPIAESEEGGWATLYFWKLVDVVPQIAGRLRWSLLSPPCLTIFHIFHIAVARLVRRSLEDDAFELIQSPTANDYFVKFDCKYSVFFLLKRHDEMNVSRGNRLIWSHKRQLLGQSTKSGSLKALRYSIRRS